jgi:hypothetical protein
MCPELPLPGTLLFNASPKRNRHMTSTLCQSIALDRLIALWAAQIAGFLIAIVETILTIARISVPLAKAGRCAWRRLMAKIETMGHMPKLPSAECQPCPCTLSVRCMLLADILGGIGATLRQTQSWRNRSLRQKAAGRRCPHVK